MSSTYFVRCMIRPTAFYIMTLLFFHSTGQYVGVVEKSITEGVSETTLKTRDISWWNFISLFIVYEINTLAGINYWVRYIYIFIIVLNGTIYCAQFTTDVNVVFNGITFMNIYLLLLVYVPVTDDRSRALLLCRITSLWFYYYYYFRRNLY